MYGFKTKWLKWAVGLILDNSPCKIVGKSVDNWLRNQRKTCATSILPSGIVTWLLHCDKNHFPKEPSSQCSLVMLMSWIATVNNSTQSLGNLFSSYAACMHFVGSIFISSCETSFCQFKYYGAYTEFILTIKAFFSRKMFGLNITLEAWAYHNLGS